MKILFSKPCFTDWMPKLNKICEKYKNIYYVKDFLNKENINLLVEKYKIKLIIPLNIPDAHLLAQFEENEINCKILSPKNSELVKILDDKGYFFDVCRKRNNLIRYLPEVFINNNHYENHVITDIIYPAIIKPHLGIGGGGIYILHSDDCLQKYKKILRNKYIVQEYIIGDTEYTANIVAIKGIITYCLTYKETFDDVFYIKKGMMNKFEIVENNFYEDFQEITRTLLYTGIICINYKVVNSKLKIFEINPRIGGTILFNNFENLLDSIDITLI